ncbi:MAG: DUF6807 family protein [Thermoguttaceae bacterium]
MSHHKSLWYIVTTSCLLLNLCCWVGMANAADESRFAFQDDTTRGVTRIVLDGKTLFEYIYDAAVDVPHFYPWHSVSGRSMTVQKTEPYPHHRSFWIGEIDVRLEGHDGKFGNYDALYARQPGAVDANDPFKKGSPAFKSRTRHVGYENIRREKDSLAWDESLVWELDGVPIADEKRHYHLLALDGGEYILDLSVNVVASYGNLKVRCDQTHYAWPYIRMNDTFSVDVGKGKIVNSEGGENQAGTNMRPASWVDYSAPTPSGDWEGVAMFLHPSQKPPHLWLTRDYGTWGPRRDRKTTCVTKNCH